MKTFILQITVGLCMIFMLSGCDQRTINVPTDPTQVSNDDAKRVLAFNYNSSISGKDYYFISLYDTVDSGKDISDDIVELSIGDSLIPMHYLYLPPIKYVNYGWFTEDTHMLDGYQNIKLRINGNIVLNTTIKSINKANAAFPGSYDHLQPLTLNWAVSSGNQYQFAKAESWANNTDGGIGPYSSYIKKIAPYARSYTFPANCVTLIGEPQYTVFVLEVQEVNYKIVNRNAVMVYQNEGYGYMATDSLKCKIRNYGNAMDLYMQIRKYGKSIM
jgi:hypothetical protein